MTAEYLEKRDIALPVMIQQFCTSVLKTCHTILCGTLFSVFLLRVFACWKKTSLKVELSHYECIIVHCLVAKGIELLSRNFTYGIII
jgi:hypothetical protein